MPDVIYAFAGVLLLLLQRRSQPAISFPLTSVNPPHCPQEIVPYVAGNRNNSRLPGRHLENRPKGWRIADTRANYLCHLKMLDSHDD